MPAEQYVYVVDDDSAVRRSFSMLMKSVELDVIACESAEEFLSKYDPTTGGCLILDMRMPNMNGIDLQKYLVAHNISIPVIVMTANGAVSNAVESIHLGALDYVEKPFDNAEMINRIRQALKLDRQQREKQQIFDRLTPREKEVVVSLVEGKSNKKTATELGISVRTVEVHRANILDKLEVNSIAELLRLAMEVGVV